MTTENSTPDARVAYLQQLEREVETARQVALAAEGKCPQAVYEQLVSRVGSIVIKLATVAAMDEATFAAWIDAGQPALVGDASGL